MQEMPRQSKFTPLGGEIMNEKEAIQHHVLNNPHHPEYWAEDSDNSKPLDVSKMPEIYIVEMVADWQAMSEELGNTIRDWFNKVNNVRWHFSPDQEELINKLIKVFETTNESLDPKFLISFAHKPEHVKGIWWYSLSTGEMKIDKTHNHNDKVFKDVAYKPDWVKGRVFDYQDEMYLMVYSGTQLKDIQLIDIVDKIKHLIGVDVHKVIDATGEDLSYLLESLAVEIRGKYRIVNLKEKKVSESGIENILVLSTDGVPPESVNKASFQVKMRNGKMYIYDAEASPYVMNTFLNQVGKKFFGRAINTIEPFINDYKLKG